MRKLSHRAVSAILRSFSRHGTKRAMLADSRRCVGCGRPLTQAQATIDHIKPKAKGGTDHAGNIQILCQPCNNRKADRLL